MSDDSFLSKEDLENISLVSVTDIRDIQMITLEARAPEDRDEELKVQLQIGNSEFKAQHGELLIRISARVDFFDASSRENDHDPGGDQLDPTEVNPVAFIKATYLIQLDLAPHVDPIFISVEKVNDLVEGNIIFMLYPYIRSTVHRLSGEMPFPPVVIPYMRR